MAALRVVSRGAKGSDSLVLARELRPPRHRGAEVRAAEIDRMVNGRYPRHARGLAVVAGAADHQPSHRMTDEDDLFTVERPGGDEIADQPGQVLAVVGDVPAAVVPDIHAGVTQVRGQPRPVGGSVGPRVEAP
jgi:hypothetical protein